MGKLKNILILLIIINVGILIYLISVKPNTNYDVYEYRAEQIANNANLTNTEQNIVEEQINSIDNMSVVAQKYQGDIAINKATDKVKDLINGGFEKFYTDTFGMNKTALKQYFENNKNTIAMQTGLTTSDDFASFINKIQIYKNNDIKCVEAKIVDDSYADEDNDYISFKVKLIYDNNSELEFKVYLSNSDFRDIPIIIIK